MKTSHLLYSSTLSATSRALTRTLVIGFAILAAFAVHGATVLSKAANVEIRQGLPFASLEFENPLAGTERVLGHAVLEWRDADYSAPSWYDDWNVYNGGSPLNGNANEIWMRASGQYIWTTTTVPSSLVSIHLNGDNNDGLADVYVDGNLVAQLDMYYGTNSQTVLILVRGLPNTTHTIQINDTGPNPSGMLDVATLGAAALKEHPLKWNQPPVTAQSTNLYNGWNQTSVTNDPWASWVGIGADDWVCMSTNPVTKIRWWGSFMNWRSNSPPLSWLPTAFQITIWTDVPTNASNPFSHPGTAIWQTHCINFNWTFAGWDYDPRTNSVEACFLFEQNLATNEYFTQPDGPGTIYWISIAAEYAQGSAGPNPWGWKTRLRDPLSAAPDDAVQILQPPPSQITPGINYISGVPIFWPTPTNSWDLAFELLSEQTGENTKWEQPPDLSTKGMDVTDSSNPGFPPYLLADDFRCTSTGPITDITIWGSWWQDALPMQNPSNVIFTLSIHSDIPANPPQNSMPGELLWTNTFYPGQFTGQVFSNDLQEGWFEPPSSYDQAGDTVCFQYDFHIDPTNAFIQTNGMIYWLDVQAQPMMEGENLFWFGWKTSWTNWNDDAVWVNAFEPYLGPWQELRYPPEHPLGTNSIDLAFRITTRQEAGEVKWSQPPVLATNGFNGWDQYSVNDTTMWVADDWVCTTTNPVTDIHWWGSFIGWSEPTNPPVVPDGFIICFWTDVPAQVDGFSHPGTLVHQIFCTNFTYSFVGWDFDPRDLTAIPDACFLFEQDFETNEWFYQDPIEGTNIYWVSIAAQYNSGPDVEYPWGWKSRPRDTNSLAPDDAVVFDVLTVPTAYQPIWWPDPTNSWDMAFALSTRATGEQDFGDAPNPYPTVLTNNAARHFILAGFCLGNNVDAETNGLPSANATGDDTNNLADEDGVIFSPPLLVSTQASVQVFLTSFSGTGQLDAWMDFNQDGSWSPGEKVLNNVTLYSGINNLTFPIPATAAVGPTFMRFRLSSAGGLLPTGAAADGDVEDYMVTNMQYRPLTNIVITNIAVTVTNVTIHWTAETNVHYWLQATTNLVGTPSIIWTNIGSEVIGPVNNQSETNSQPAERYYRIIAPYVWP